MIEKRIKTYIDNLFSDLLFLLLTGTGRRKKEKEENGKDTKQQVYLSHFFEDGDMAFQGVEVVC